MRNRILDDSQILTNLIIVIVTFFFAAFFVASEFALVQTRPSALDERKKKLIETKGKQAKGLKKLNRQLHMVTNLNEYLSTTQVGVSLAGIILGYLGESFVVTILVDIMEIHNSPIDPTAAHAVGAVLGIIILTYLEVVLTEIVPKKTSVLICQCRYFHSSVRHCIISTSCSIHLFGYLIFPQMESSRWWD